MISTQLLRHGLYFCMAGRSHSEWPLRTEKLYWRIRVRSFYMGIARRSMETSAQLEKFGGDGASIIGQSSLRG